jgi:beta-glucanase (GH16 family)
MTIHFISLLVAFGSPLIPGQVCSDDPSGRQDSRWKLVWSDEFDAPGPPDPKKWGYDLGGHGWGNSELQNYTDRRANSRVEEGRLIIEARKETLDKNAYTSARLVSKGKGEWQEGRIEVRAKLPGGRGSWPAIWLLAATDKLRWPDDGEIDVMEHVGFDSGIVHASIHTKKYNHLAGTHKTATTKVADCSTAFHTYSVEWSRDRMDFFVDDTKYFTYPRESGAGADTWPFDKKFYLILNLAVGGSWGGQKGVDDSIFPARMEVDYVRVYERSGAPPQ